LHLDYVRDFVPVFFMSQAPAILVVTPSAPVKTVAELISLAKSSPHGIEMASAGFGSLSHLCLEIFRHKAGITVHHVPYRGGAQALNDLMSGHVKYFFGSAVTATGLIKAGKLRGLAHTWRGELRKTQRLQRVIFLIGHLLRGGHFKVNGRRQLMARFSRRAICEV